MTANTRLLWRLAITMAAALLMLLALAYWWQGNLFHEIAGTTMFLLLIGHNVINRWWYSTIRRTPPDRRRRILVVVNLALLLPMLVLLVTSIVISQSLFAFLPIRPSYTMREIHALAAYWGLLMLSIHLGLHWPIVMNAVAGALGLSNANATRSAILRACTFAVALYGAASLQTMGLGSKLVGSYTMDMWDFNEAAVEFLVNFGSIVAIIAAVTHYGIRLLVASR